MNKLILLTIVILTSCSASKQDVSIINSFMENELKSFNKDSVIISEVKIKKSKVINIYKDAYRERHPYIKERIEGVWVMPENIAWPFTIEEIDKQLKPEKDTLWHRKDFKDKKYIISNRSGSRDSDEKFERYIKNDIYIYSLSEPIFNKDRSYAIFKYVQSFYPTQTYNHGVVIMQKINGKWQKVGLLTEAIYN